MRTQDIANEHRISEEQLDACEQEQLHLSGAIQPHGAIVVSDIRGQILAAGGRTFEVMGLAPKDVVGRNLRELFPPALSLLAIPPVARSYRRELFRQAPGPDGRGWEAMAGFDGQTCLVEWQESESAVPSPYRPASIDVRIDPDDPALANALVRSVRRLVQLTGFAKCMAYQFQDDWSGRVIAEAGQADVFDQYLGLRFPASDIPSIARKLYLKNPYRMICDVSANPEPLARHSLDGHQDAVPDLTHSDLRSVSPVHVQYLKNMTVNASLSLPIVVHGEMWGLFALHHPVPAFLSLGLREECVKVVATLQMRLGSALGARKFERMANLDGRLARLASAVRKGQSISARLDLAQEQFADVLGACGCVLIAGGTVYTSGMVPAENTILKVDAFCRTHESESGLFMTSAIDKSIPDIGDLTGVAGLISLSRREPERMVLQIYRAELPQTIHWAGRPEKYASPPGTPFSISPRASFQKWTEVTAGSSMPWSLADKAVALRISLDVIRPLFDGSPSSASGR